MEIADRLKQIMDREGLTNGAFADKLGVAQATISHIMNGRSKYPSTEVLLKFHEVYPDVDIEWLLTGKEKEAEILKMPDSAPPKPENRQEIQPDLFAQPAQTVVKQEIVYRDKPARKITEIRIFYDDNTFQIFRPEDMPSQE